MTAQNLPYAKSDIQANDYVPFLVAGKQYGEVHWLRTEGSNGSTLAAGLWRSQALTFDYPFAEDETIQVLAGELTVDLGTGAPLVLGPGDIASFAKGTASTWTVTDGFKKFFVVSG